MMASCAPLGTFRPVSALMNDRDREIGLGAVTVSPRPYVDEPWRQAGQLWFSTKATSWLNLSAISTFDAQALGVGIGGTALIVQSNRFAAGVEAEAGYGWAAAGIPIAGRLFEQTWIYASPRVTNYGIYPALSLPAGLSVHLEKGAFVRLEYQASWVNLQAYELRHHFGTAMVVQW
jgi:hypothetical protein